MSSREDLKLHRALRALPPRRAPRTLLPRVMAAVAAEQAKVPGRTAWWDWSLPAQAAYILLVAAASALVLWLGLGAVLKSSAALSSARAAAGGFWVLASALWRLGGQPLQGLVIVMAASCAAFATGLAGLAERPAPAKTI